MFRTIIVFNRVGGNEIAREKCKVKKAGGNDDTNEADFIPPGEAVLCERCGCGDRADVLLLCDGEVLGEL